MTRVFPRSLDQCLCLTGEAEPELITFALLIARISLAFNAQLTLDNWVNTVNRALPVKLVEVFLSVCTFAVSKFAQSASWRILFYWKVLDLQEARADAVVECVLLLVCPQKSIQKQVFLHSP